MSEFELTALDPAAKEIKNKVKGYAAAPGHGPKGERCKTCAHAYQRSGGSRAFWKCDLVPPTGGPGTDIRLKSPACFRWEPLGTETTCRRCSGKKIIRYGTMQKNFKYTYEDKPCPDCNGTGRFKAQHLTT